MGTYRRLLKRSVTWLSSPVLVLSLLGQVWLYTYYLLGLPALWFSMLVIGLLLFAFVALLTIRMICRMLFVHILPPEWMRHSVSQLSRHLGIRQPELFALSTAGINAFALGDVRSSGVIFYHIQMPEHLTQDEVEAVLAHELSHLAAGHATLMTFLQGITVPLLAPLAAIASLFISLLFGIRDFRQHFIQIYHVLNVLLFPVTTLLIALVMRQWEYIADAQAASLIGKPKYIAALQCLHGSFFQHPDLLNLSGTRAAPAKDQWALSHPRLKQRIHALRELG